MPISLPALDNLVGINELKAEPRNEERCFPSQRQRSAKRPFCLHVPWVNRRPVLLD